MTGRSDDFGSRRFFVLAQTPLNEAPVQNLVPGQSQAAYAPSPMNQYPANPVPFQLPDTNMGLNAVAKNTIPDNTQVWGSVEIH